ncbi:unnamed protein product [Rhizophagus irregularis]|nr:unnamed protein product [Rhizophagus irregularis]CAB5188817.1 unnamed protein product [Rhizophagus irregularis]
MQRGFGHRIFSNRNGEIETDYIGQKKLLHNSESHFYKRYKTGTNSYKENCQPCVEYLEFQKDSLSYSVSHTLSPIPRITQYHHHREMYFTSSKRCFAPV